MARGGGRTAHLTTGNRVSVCSGGEAGFMKVSDGNSAARPGGERPPCGCQAINGSDAGDRDLIVAFGQRAVGCRCYAIGVGGGEVEPARSFGGGEVGDDGTGRSNALAHPAAFRKRIGSDRRGVRAFNARCTERPMHCAAFDRIRVGPEAGVCQLLMGEPTDGTQGDAGVKVADIRCGLG